MRRIFLIFAFLLSVASILEADLDKLRSLYLQGNYQDALIEAKVILMDAKNTDAICETYFYMGLSYMKQGVYDEARESFYKLIKDYPKCKFADRAHLSIGDSYFLQSDFKEALGIYSEALAQRPRSDYLSVTYFRLGQVNQKLGNWEAADKYFEIIKQKFQNSPDAAIADSLSKQEHFFTIQVGAFLHKNSAEKLVDSLKEKAYDSYIKEYSSKDGTLYRVRVAKLSTRKEAEDLELKLSQEGYPTIIFP